MACDTTCYRSGVVPLAFFRMMRDEQRRRQLVSMNREKSIEGVTPTTLPVHVGNSSAAEETIPSNSVALRHAQGR